MKFLTETLVHRVIIKPFIETETKGGIILAQSERSQAINSDRGTVFQVGPKADVAVKPGDKVFYAKYGAKVLKGDTDKELYIIVNDEDVLVSYTEEDA